MSPFRHVEEGPAGEVQLSVHATFSDRTSENGPVLTEHNYMRLSGSSSRDCSVSPVRSLDLSLSSNAKYGEKSLLFLDPSEEGIPEAKQFRRNNFPSLQTVLSDGSTFIGNSELELMSAGVKAGSDTWHAGGRDRSGAVILSPKPSQDLLAKNVSVKHYQRASPSMVKENVPLKICHDRPHVSKEFNVSSIGPAVDYEFSLVAKEQVVGWPPIRSYLKSTLAANSKSNDEVQGKPSSGPLFIKVSMDGAPYLRKMDLKTCATYDELSSSLEKMFSFTICRCGSNRAPSKDVLNDGKLMDILNGSEYAITYKDKDGDWMLLGDVPWEMFVSFCKRIRIMKGYDAIGLAPKAMLKSRSGS